MTRPRALLPFLQLLLLLPAGAFAQPGVSPHGVASGAQPLRDPELPAGTVSVLAKINGKPVPNVAVLLLPADSWQGSGKPEPGQAILRGKTNAEGRLFLRASAFSGRSVRLAVQLQNAVRASVPFQVPARGGVRFLFAAGGAPHGMSGSQMRGPSDLPPGHPGAGQSRITGPTTRDPGTLQIWVGFRVMAIEGGEIYLGLIYEVMNRGSKTFVPGIHGLLLPAPLGASHVSVPRGTRSARQDEKGVRLVVPVPPGGRAVRVRASCRLPYDAATRTVRLLSALPVVGYVVSMRAYRTVRARGSDLLPADGRAHGATAETMLLYRSAERGFPRNDIQFAFVGLPVRSRSRSWPFAILALLLALGGIVLSIRWHRQRQGPRRARSGADPAGVEAAVAQERDRLLGLSRD